MTWPTATVETSYGKPPSFALSELTILSVGEFVPDTGAARANDSAGPPPPNWVPKRLRLDQIRKNARILAIQLETKNA